MPKESDKAIDVSVYAIPKSAVDFQLRVCSRLSSIKTDFVEIGCYLKLAQERLWYFDLGYDSITGCAEALFDANILVYICFCVICKKP